MAVYVDGSALSRFFLDVPQSAEWRAWAMDRIPELRRSELSVTELRRVTWQLSRSARVVADALVERIKEVRFSDQALARAATVEGRLTPFAALHFGVAKAEPDVDAIATYDPLLAATCHLHRLRVVTPGRAELWWSSVVPTPRPPVEQSVGRSGVGPGSPRPRPPAEGPPVVRPAAASGARPAPSPRPLQEHLVSTVPTPAEPVRPRWFALDGEDPAGPVPE